MTGAQRLAKAGWDEAKAAALAEQWGPLVLTAAVEAVEEHGFSRQAVETILETEGVAALTIVLSACRRSAKGHPIAQEILNEIDRHPEATKAFYDWCLREGKRWLLTEAPVFERWLLAAGRWMGARMLDLWKFVTRPFRAAGS